MSTMDAETPDITYERTDSRKYSATFSTCKAHWGCNISCGETEWAWSTRSSFAYTAASVKVAGACASDLPAREMCDKFYGVLFPENLIPPPFLMVRGENPSQIERVALVYVHNLAFRYHRDVVALVPSVCGMCVGRSSGVQGTKKSAPSRAKCHFFSFFWNRRASCSDFRTKQRRVRL